MDRQNQLANLLYSTSQYDDEEDQFHKKFQSVHDRYKDRFPEEIGQDEAVELGNGESVEHDHWNDDQQEPIQWNNQQQVRFHFRQVAGNSQQFSRSLSINNRYDLLQSRGMHDSSINIQTILNNKKKQEHKVNEVIQSEIQQLMQQNSKQKCLIEGQKKIIKQLNENIDQLNQTIDQLRYKNDEIEERNTAYLRSIEKKDALFSQIKAGYKQANEKVQEGENQLKALIAKYRSLENQNSRLNEIIHMYTNEEKNLLDFRPNSIKRSQQRPLSPIKNYPNQELEKIKRDYNALQTQYSYLEQKNAGQKQKMKFLEEQTKRKISLKQKKLKQITENLSEAQQQINRIKKSNENTSSGLKDKLYRLQMDISDKEEKIKALQSKSKYSLEEIRKKEEKIKQLLAEIEIRNKKINETKDKLQQEEARNEIEGKLQKQRESQIDKLQKQVNQLKSQKYTLQTKMETLQKPSIVQNKLKKQNQQLKSTNQKFLRKNKQLTEDVQNYEREAVQKDQKIKELKRKNDDLSKKILNATKSSSSLSSPLNKKKSVDEKSIGQKEFNQLKEKLFKSTQQNDQLKAVIESNQQKLNRLYILQNRLQHYKAEQSGFQSEQAQGENCFSYEEQIQALQQEIQFKEDEIKSLKQAHQMEIRRLNEQIKVLETSISERQEDFMFKQKSLQYMHQKFLLLEKQNTELRAKKNILHSSFYDEEQNDDGDGYQSSIKFLQNKINSLEQALHERQIIISKLSNNQNKERENSSARFENNKLKARVKQLTDLLLTTQNRKIVPESLSKEQTIQFLEKTIRRILKSGDMIRMLARSSDFLQMISTLYRVLEKQANRSSNKQVNMNAHNLNYNHSSHTNLGSYNHRR